ncbi:MAG: nuclear transport factor 2 family protein [Planctomycetota bacterium]
MLARALFLSALATAARCAPQHGAASQAETRIAIGRVLDDFHDAASKADGARYFDDLAPEAVFLGTDGGERWTKEAFRAYAEPYFVKGKGWTFVPGERHIELAPEGTVAWFDERLANAKYGDCRGSGVLRKMDGKWRITQYNLSVPVPNDLMERVVALIRERAK